MNILYYTKVQEENISQDKSKDNKDVENFTNSLMNQEVKKIEHGKKYQII